MEDCLSCVAFLQKNINLTITMTWTCDIVNTCYAFMSSDVLIETKIYSVAGNDPSKCSSDIPTMLTSTKSNIGE